MCYVEITTVYLVFFPCPGLPSIRHIQVRLVRGKTKLKYGALVVTDLYDFSTMTSECELLILTTPPKQRPFPSNIPQVTASQAPWQLSTTTARRFPKNQMEIVLLFFSSLGSRIYATAQ